MICLSETVLLNHTQLRLFYAFTSLNSLIGMSIAFIALKFVLFFTDDYTSFYIKEIKLEAIQHYIWRQNELVELNSFVFGGGIK